MDNKIIYINLDGFSYSYYQRLEKEGKASIFDELKGEGAFFENLYSGVISITNPMQSAILCGGYADVTDNAYDDYDCILDEMVSCKRTMNAENAVEGVLRAGGSALSIHQFMLENHPCKEGEMGNAYVKSNSKRSFYHERFAFLKKVILGEPILSGEKILTYQELPDLTCIYIDDLDSLGHNDSIFDGYERRKTFEEREQDIVKRLIGIQAELKEIVLLLKLKGFWEKTTIVLTTDHGMTPISGKGKLKELKKALNENGFKAEVVGNCKKDTELVISPFTIEAKLYERNEITLERREKLGKIIEALPYVDKVLNEKQLKMQFHMGKHAPLFLISPVFMEHFSAQSFDENYINASHDSLLEKAQRIFGMIIGNDVKNMCVKEHVANIDLLSTLLAVKQNVILKNSYATIHNELFK